MMGLNDQISEFIAEFRQKGTAGFQHDGLLVVAVTDTQAREWSQATKWKHTGNMLVSIEYDDGWMKGLVNSAEADTQVRHCLRWLIHKADRCRQKIFQVRMRQAAGEAQYDSISQTYFTPPRRLPGLTAVKGMSSDYYIPF